MADQEPEHREPAGNEHEKFEKEVDRKEQRKIDVLRHGKESVWFGLGMFGVIGWSVAIPTLLGIAFGIWLDEHWHQGRVSWTLTFLVVGVFLGCLNAWYWIARERDSIRRNNRRKTESNGMPERNRRKR